MSKKNRQSNPTKTYYQKVPGGTGQFERTYPVQNSFGDGGRNHSHKYYNPMTQGQGSRDQHGCRIDKNGKRIVNGYDG